MIAPSSHPILRSPQFLLTVGLLLFMAGVVGAMGCAQGLPEPESEAAQLYVRYCSGEGCHGAIPPQSNGPGYWRNQTDRMLVLMREQGWPLPNAEEDRKIRDYLQKFAVQ